MLFGTPLLAAEQHVSGIATAIDGDSLEFAGGMKVRLTGIDAPELQQQCIRDSAPWRCGEEAQRILSGLITGNQITCIGTMTDEHGRLLATCKRSGHDLGMMMIEAGLAVTRSDSPAEYLVVEALRQQYKIGLWASEFEAPSAWRIANPRAAPEHARPQDRQPVRQQAIRPPEPEQVYRNKWGCAIKGNRNRKGQWIYHLPGRPYYDQTKAEELFCTETEARAAGYRRSKA